MISRIILWRHGQTDLNKQRRLQGASDYPLNDTGIAQAKAAAKKIAELGPTHIVSSDLTRAYDTATRLAKRTGLQIAVDPRVQERSFGSWEGLTADEIGQIDREGLNLWRAGQEPGGDVETREACGRRVVTAIADWTDRLADHNEAVLVIVSHGGAISNGLMSLLGTNPSLSQPLAGMDNCHWGILAPQPNRAPAWRLMAYNLS
ncbi:histidine phosphatase family protein [Flaviflexus huanghaiensis]|uniref:histidine phosphatase family protein n=1 Tax=Flaviflexus huanghaiensis TaxID=1111473 RepID=UPI0015FAB9CB|nr:histidine phosphatase family protein [Flaviflexus huanghaiensis]